MKNNALTLLLVAILSVTALWAVVLAIWHVWSINAIQQLQADVTRVDRKRNLAVALGNEAMEYSKRNPAINPILVSVKLKTNPVPPAATSKPAAK